MAQLRNDERLFVLLDLARRRPDVLQALAPPELLEKFEGAESLPEKLQILLAAKGVERAAIFLTSSQPLRRALVQSAFAGDLYNVIERYKRDLFELVPDDADADALSNVLQRFGGGYCAHNRTEERGLGNALAAGQRNAATRAGLRLALALGRRPEVRLDEIESSSLRGLPVQLIRAMARQERRSGPTRKRRAQAAADLAEEKRRRLDAKQAEDAAVARTRNLEREQQVRETSKWTEMPTKYKVSDLVTQLAIRDVFTTHREAVQINFDGQAVTARDKTFAYGTVTASKAQLATLLDLLMNGFGAKRETGSRKTLILLERSRPATPPTPTPAVAAPPPAAPIEPTPVAPEAPEPVLADADVDADVAPAPAAAAVALEADAEPKRKRQRSAPKRMNL